MTPQAYKKYLFRHYEDMQKKLVKNKDMSQACRTYIRANLDMNLFSLSIITRVTLVMPRCFRAGRG